MRPLAPFATALIAALGIALSPATASADPPVTPALISPSAAPAVISDGLLNQFWPGFGNTEFTVVVGNRDASRTLERVTLDVTFYDDTGVRLSTATIVFRSLNIGPGVKARETDNYIPINASTARAKAVLVSAVYLGGATWTANYPWKGRLLSFAQPDQGQPHENQRQAAAPTSVTVAKVGDAWTDAIDGQGYVHARVAVNAQTPTVIRSTDLRLTLGLPNGGVQYLAGMSGAAPQVVKMNGLQQPSVSPADDLGALGDVNIEPGRTATFIVTFALTSPYAPGAQYDIRDVSLAQAQR